MVLTTLELMKLFLSEGVCIPQKVLLQVHLIFNLNRLTFCRGRYDQTLPVRQQLLEGTVHEPPPETRRPISVDESALTTNSNAGLISCFDDQLMRMKDACGEARIDMAFEPQPLVGTSLAL